ncbi:MAG: hypothetical protein U0525_04085 [Patescibacteria group bacterium]
METKPIGEVKVTNCMALHALVEGEVIQCRTPLGVTPLVIGTVADLTRAPDQKLEVSYKNSACILNLENDWDQSIVYTK